jgi:hypothetical protein
MRWLVALIGTYVLVAVLTRLAEAVRLHQCGCSAECWCKKPPRSVFRWVFPYGQRAIEPHQKELLGQARSVTRR